MTPRRDVPTTVTPRRDADGEEEIGPSLLDRDALRKQLASPRLVAAARASARCQKRALSLVLESPLLQFGARQIAAATRLRADGLASPLVSACALHARGALAAAGTVCLTSTNKPATAETCAGWEQRWSRLAASRQTTQLPARIQTAQVVLLKSQACDFRDRDSPSQLHLPSHLLDCNNARLCAAAYVHTVQCKTAPRFRGKSRGYRSKL